jgi:hypothetical protein
MGFRLVIAYIELLQLVPTSKYYALTLLNTQITIGHIGPSQSDKSSLAVNQ